MFSQWIIALVRNIDTLRIQITLYNCISCNLYWEVAGGKKTENFRLKWILDINWILNKEWIYLSVREWKPHKIMAGYV